MAVTCSRCGGQHPVWDCKAKASQIAAWLAVNHQNRPDAPGKRKPGPKPKDGPKFDRTAYQREYMRKRRARLKAQKEKT